MFSFLLGMLAFASGCAVGPLDLAGKQCPCAEGWVCNETLHSCVRAADMEGGDDAAVASRLDAGATSRSEADSGNVGVATPTKDASAWGASDAEASDTGTMTSDAGMMTSDASTMTSDAESPAIDCDGSPAQTWWNDADHDGFGETGPGVVACAQPPGSVANGDDCDDFDPARHPGAAELCDTIDSDCDAAMEDGCPAQCTARKYEARLYMFCNTPVSWSDASTACTSAGFAMARIDTVAENDFVHAVAVELFPNGDGWLGGSDALAEGEWRWPNGDPFWNGTSSGSAENGAYSRWATGQPNGGVAENCMELRGGSFWNDVACDALRNVICEHD